MRLMSRNVLRKMASSEARRYGSSQSNFHCLYLSAMGCNAKFIEPMLSEHISGEKAAAAAMRSSIVIMKLPPVVMLTTALVDCLMVGRKRLNNAGSPDGTSVGGIARVQMQDRRSGLGRADRLRGDVLGPIRQRIRHGRGMNRSGDCAADDHLVRGTLFFSHFSLRRQRARRSLRGARSGTIVYETGRRNSRRRPSGQTAS